MLLFMMMIIYYRGSKMIDLQSADSGLDKLWPNIDAVLNALLAFQITTLCPMLLFLFVGCWFECITRIFYTCRCSISCTSECLEWKIHISALLGSKKTLLAEIRQTSHSGHFLRIPFEKWPPHTVPPWKIHQWIFIPNFFFF